MSKPTSTAIPKTSWADGLPQIPRSEKTSYLPASSVSVLLQALPGDSPSTQTPEYCRLALDASLKRLGLPFIDLYYVHRLDKKTPIELTMRMMVELKNAGKIKYIGLSECGAESLRRAHAVHPITAVQLEYSLFCTEIESPQRRLLEVARELGVTIVAYSPLGNGFLTGKLRSREDVSKPGDARDSCRG
ncbi:Aldo/keto reductase [Penicillium maclennaniae]|uniref:Aldo/keto reductase n=1 Tax=Penicillium maclennaniae TaxID=1343394 RepID=UPI002541803B|nr:Aldo/keto reductase [Penicillium maclennaniae]KAJ5677004.1 Aldo/keto reductase [Penicillium maclennaniae]